MEIGVEYEVVYQDASDPAPPGATRIAKYGDQIAYFVYKNGVDPLRKYNAKTPLIPPLPRICPCGIDRRDCEYHK